MKTIRKGLFETNSSSTHSISISKSNLDDFLDTIPLDEDGNIVLRGGQFGWEWEKYNDALTKANYCATYAAIRLINKPYNREYYRMLIDVVKDQTGANDVLLDIDMSFRNEDRPFIDHDSYDTARRIFKNMESLRQFIFNSNSVLFLGNDNTTAPDKFYGTPETVWKYRLEIPIMKESNFKDYQRHFEKLPSEKELIEYIVDLLYSLAIIRRDGKDTVIDTDAIDIRGLTSGLGYNGYGVYNLFRYYGLTVSNKSSKLIDTKLKVINLVNDPLLEKTQDVDISDVIQIPYKLDELT